MANSPILFGSNNTSTNLQNQMLTASGELIQSNGLKNYIQYNNFENQATTGWSLGTVGTLINGIPTGTPTFGSGAAGALSLSVVSSGQLTGTASLLLTSSAATTIGNMLASDPLPIDLADRAQILTASFKYSIPANPANGNFSGTSANTYGIACYDVTNSSWLPVVGNFAMTQNSGAGTASVTMQTNATTASLRFVIYMANASAGAISLECDRFYLGPQTVPTGSVVTDLQSYALTIGAVTTPPTKGGVLIDNAQWRRIGNSMEISYQFQWNSAGTAGSGVYLFPLPFGYSIDLTKIKDIVNPGTALGMMTRTVTGVGNFTGAPVLYDATRLQLFDQQNNAYISSTSGPLSGSGGGFSFIATVPIAGWSSNVQMSSDTDTRVISFSGSNPGGAITAGVDIPFTVSTDRSGAWNGTQFKVPVSGDYSVSGNIGNSVTNTPSVFINGSQFLGNYFSTATAGNQSSGTILVTGCKAGDLLTVRTNASGTLSNGVLFINRLSGPAVIAANESVNARYYASVTTVSASLATIVWSTKDFDSHNAMSAGIFTAPSTGKYQINTNLQTTGTIALNTTVLMQIQKNNVAVTEFQTFAGGAMSAQNGQLSDAIQLNAGDTIRIQFSTSAGTPVISTSNTRNYISITRVGN